MTNLAQDFLQYNSAHKTQLRVIGMSPSSLVHRQLSIKKRQTEKCSAMSMQNSTIEIFSGNIALIIRIFFSQEKNFLNWKNLYWTVWLVFYPKHSKHV